MEAKETKESAKRNAKEAKKAEAQAKKEAEQKAKEKAKGGDNEPAAPAAELYNGMVKLTIAPPLDLGQVRELEEHLSRVPDLRLILIGGSIEGGTEIIVSAESPIPLLDILRGMTPVAEVVKKGKTAQVTLKAK